MAGEEHQVLAGLLPAHHLPAPLGERQKVGQLLSRVVGAGLPVQLVEGPLGGLPRLIGQAGEADAARFQGRHGADKGPLIEGVHIQGGPEAVAFLDKAPLLGVGEGCRIIVADQGPKAGGALLPGKPLRRCQQGRASPTAPVVGGHLHPQGKLPFPLIGEAPGGTVAHQLPPGALGHQAQTNRPLRGPLVGLGQALRG